jgi:hypothetical protein
MITVSPLGTPSVCSAIRTRFTNRQRAQKSQYAHIVFSCARKADQTVGVPRIQNASPPDFPNTPISINNVTPPVGARRAVPFSDDAAKIGHMTKRAPTQGCPYHLFICLEKNI